MTALTLDPWPDGWTVADIRALPDNGVRYELVDGVPRPMTPPKMKHHRATKHLERILEEAAPDGVTVWQNVGLVLADDQRPVPDVVVLASQDDERSDVEPDVVLLVSEVVSRSSRSDDRFRKPAQYAAAGIPVFLRVEPEPLHVVAYGLDSDGVYAEIGRAVPGEKLTLTEPFAVSVDPAQLAR